jgi:hypothetical protein
VQLRFAVYAAYIMYLTSFTFDWQFDLSFRTSRGRWLEGSLTATVLGGEKTNTVTLFESFHIWSHFLNGTNALMTQYYGR